MNVDQLIKMANEIGAFFATESQPGQGPADVATHLRRYWNPRMRAQIIDYCRARNAAGLSDLARAAVELLAEQSGAPKASGEAAVPELD